MSDSNIGEPLFKTPAQKVENQLELLAKNPNDKAAFYRMQAEVNEIRGEWNGNKTIQGIEAYCHDHHLPVVQLEDAWANGSKTPTRLPWFKK